jgi:hypothetical protein
VRASLEAHLGSRQVAKVVYGSIIGLALLLAVSSHPPPSGSMVAIVIGTAVAVGLAEIYSEIVGIETSERHKVTRAQWTFLLEEAAAVTFGAGFPAVFFALSALHVFDESTAFTVAKWTGLGLIGFYGFWASRLTGAPTHHALLRGFLIALVGAGLIVLKALVH